MEAELRLPTGPVLIRSAVPPEFIDIQLYRDVLKDLIVTGFTSLSAALAAYLFAIWKSRQKKNETFEVRITVKALHENRLTEITTSFSEVSKEEVNYFLSEGVEKVDSIAEKISEFHNDSVTIYVECKGSNTTVKHVVVRGTGYIDFSSFL